jgi:hypothetical protein
MQKTRAIVPFLTSDPDKRYRIVGEFLASMIARTCDTSQATKTVPQITASAIMSHIKIHPVS